MDAIRAAQGLRAQAAVAGLVTISHPHVVVARDRKFFCPIASHVHVAKAAGYGRSSSRFCFSEVSGETNGEAIQGDGRVFWRTT